MTTPISDSRCDEIARTVTWMSYGEDEARDRDRAMIRAGAAERDAQHDQRAGAEMCDCPFIGGQHSAWCDTRNDGVPRDAQPVAADDAALIEECLVAMNDWLHSYAPEMCKPEHVEATRERLNEHGTLAYIAFLSDKLRAALTASQPVAVPERDRPYYERWLALGGPYAPTAPREPTQIMVDAALSLNPALGPPEHLTQERIFAWEQRHRKAAIALWIAMHDAFTASRKAGTITCDDDWDRDPPSRKGADATPGEGKT